MRFKQIVVISLSSIGLGITGLLLPSTVSAIEQGDDSSVRVEISEESTKTRNETMSERTAERDGVREAKKQVAKEKLDAQKMKRCETREESVNTVIKNVNSRSQKRFDRMTKIYDMTKAFYVKHALTVESYDQLVASVETAKTQASEKRELLAMEPRFDCGSDAPRAALQDFETKRKAKVDAYQAYRQAVRALVDAVCTAAKAQLLEPVGGELKQGSQDE